MVDGKAFLSATKILKKKQKKIPKISPRLAIQVQTIL
jgi:hypothetical protein